MAIPPFVQFFKPVLEILSDGEVRTNKEIHQAIDDRFEFSEEEKKELLSSGQPRYKNRVEWALTHLRHAGLIENPKRGHQRITIEGKDLLKKDPSDIDLKTLDQYSSHEEFRSGKKEDGEKHTKTEVRDEVVEETATPSETIDRAWNQLQEELSKELLDQVRNNSAEFFEYLVIDVLVGLGYGGNRENAARKIGKVADGGVDGIIHEDPLGLDVIYVQAKRWQDTVGRPEIQKFAGALQEKRAKKGVFISTSSFSKEAQGYVNGIDSRIVLIDGDYLAKLMIDKNIGVSITAQYPLKKVDMDYFIEE